MSIRIIDPPSGWKYGFPKPFPKKVENLNSWLVENGYPKEEIEKYGEHFYCRYWDQPDEMDDDPEACSESEK